MIGISRIIANTTETEQIKDVKESFNLPSGYFDNYYQFQNYFSLLEEISAHALSQDKVTRFLTILWAICFF